jgi:hypothetical protein
MVIDHGLPLEVMLDSIGNRLVGGVCGAAVLARERRLDRLLDLPVFLRRSSA